MRILLHAAVATCMAGGAAAQDSVPATDGSALLLPAQHWAVAAAHRAEAMGLAPGFFPASARASRAEVAAALDEAARNGGDLAAGWLARFQEEFPGEASGAVWRGGAVGGGYRREGGRIEPARGVGEARTVPGELPGAARVIGVAEGSAAVSGLAARATLLAAEDHLSAEEWEVALRGAGLVVSVGRTTEGYGPTGDGLVLSSPAALPRLELRSDGAWAPGGVLGFLGRMTAHTFLSRLDESRHPTDPYLWGARVAVQPHPRLTLAVNRAAIFGGDSARATPGRLLGMLVGTLNEGLENQVVAAEGRYRLPTERWLPLAIQAEWGAEDASGAWWEQPAVALGLHAAALPGAPELSVGVRGAWFAACCGHGSWYHHSEFTGHWVTRSRPLGHPLGGEGREVAILAAAELMESRLRLSGRGFARHRSHESARQGGGFGNLLTPTREGDSLGGVLEVLARPERNFELTLRGYLDEGAAWREHSMDLELRMLF